MHPKERIWKMIGEEGFEDCPRNCPHYKPSKVWSAYGATEVAEELAECNIPAPLEGECPRLAPTKGD